MDAVDARLIGFNALGAMRVTAPMHVSRGRIDPEAVRQWEPRRRMLIMNFGPKGDRNAPMVSCLMLTRDRVRQAKLAVRLYRRQTWLNRELVVIDSSVDGTFAEWIASLGDPSIRLIKVDRAAEITLGELRNLSVAEARGAYICQWDDDDLHHPARIEAQMTALKAADARVCLLLRELVWFPSGARLAISRERGHEHSLICEKAILPPFPALPRGEDTPVMRALLASQPFTLLNLPELYVYVVHGSNTWGESHMDTIWRKSTRRFEGPAYGEMFYLLSRCYPLGDYIEALGRGSIPRRPVVPAARRLQRGAHRHKPAGAFGSG